MSSDKFTRQSGMERSYKRHGDWNNHKLSVESFVCVDNLSTTAHSATILSSTVDGLHISRCGEKILFENLFPKQSCKTVA